jgi:hypothetical protein
VYQCKGCYGNCIQAITQEPYDGPIERCGISGDVAKWERAPKHIERQFTSANSRVTKRRGTGGKRSAS